MVRDPSDLRYWYSGKPFQGLLKRSGDGQRYFHLGSPFRYILPALIPWQIDGYGYITWAVINPTTTWEADGTGGASWIVGADQYFWRLDGVGNVSWVPFTNPIGWILNGTGDTSWSGTVAIGSSSPTWNIDGIGNVSWIPNAPATKESCITGPNNAPDTSGGGGARKNVVF